jgi:hypothetical protein
VRVGGDIMHVVDIGCHLALGYKYQIWFAIRPTKEYLLLLLLFKRRTEN